MSSVDIDMTFSSFQEVSSVNTSECTKMRAECVGSMIFRTTALARRIWQKKSGEEPVRAGMLKITDTVQIFLFFFCHGHNSFYPTLGNCGVLNA